MRLAGHLLTRALRAEPGARAAWSELSLVLLNDRQMRSANLRCTGRDEVTDVISYRYPAVPGDEGGGSAEIVLNVELAIREGCRRWTPSRELALYLAHGCDHLAGARDSTPAARTRMIRRETRWVRAAAARGLLEGLMMAERRTSRGMRRRGTQRTNAERRTLNVER